MKVIHVPNAAPEAQETLRSRFRREAQSAARLRHPNVVTVFDYGTDDDLGLDYLVMELLEGEDVAARVQREGALAVSLGLRILGEAAREIAAGHRAGLIHRDVKPANLFLEKGDNVSGPRGHVLDFGIAQVLEASEETLTHLTVFGPGPDSPGFASPEQLRGVRGLTPASDVYSLGATGIFILTGSKPTLGATLGPLGARGDVLTPVLTVRPEIPEAIWRVLRRATLADPSERYADAGQFAEAVALAAGEIGGLGMADGSPKVQRVTPESARGRDSAVNSAWVPPNAVPQQRIPLAAPREHVPWASELAGRVLRIAPEVLRAGNPRRPYTHGWLAFEVLLRSEEGALAVDEYCRRLFHPAPDIRSLARQIPGVPDAYQDLKHIRHDIRHGRVLVD